MCMCVCMCVCRGICLYQFLLLGAASWCGLWFSQSAMTCQAATQSTSRWQCNALQTLETARWLRLSVVTFQRCLFLGNYICQKCSVVLATKKPCGFLKYCSHICEAAVKKTFPLSTELSSLMLFIGTHEERPVFKKVLLQQSPKLLLWWSSHDPVWL